MPPVSRFFGRPLWMAVACALAVASAIARDLPFLNPIFGDNMVLQRDQTNRFWGWSEPGSAVSLTVAGNSSSSTSITTTAGDGRWEISFTPPAAGGPYTIHIEGSESAELTNVLVGDVWLCAGQSNMAYGLGGIDNADEEIAGADYPQIRQFSVPNNSAYSPVAVADADWVVCSPDTAGGFSAIAYLFARRIHQETGVPIGLIRDAVGGSAIECWMSPQALARFADFQPHLAKLAELRASDIPREYGSFLMHWLDEYDIGEHADVPWQSPDFDDSDWQTVTVPDGFSDLGLAESAGVAWFRREVELPDPLPAGRARLHLGRVDKMDTSYFNGEWIGASSWVGNPRRHWINEDLLKPGRNVIAVRIFKRPGPGGGIPAEDGIPHLALGDGTVISLKGDWKGRVSVDASPPHPLPLGFENYPTMPTVMYQGMIEPIVPLAIRGALWYQGEENSSRGFQYRKLLPGLIADWRRAFKKPDLPVYIAGLPAFMKRKDTPSSDGWTEIREAQWLATQTVPHTGLAVAVDTGDADDIHPRDKQQLGERLALAALGGTYGVDVVWRGPTYASHETMAGAIKVNFLHTDGGLVVKGESPAGEFAIAGADRVWHWATGQIEGDHIIVSSPEVPEPVAVRYAWQANPLANLYNGAGLPAVPFRTDDWPGVTE